MQHIAVLNHSPFPKGKAALPYGEASQPLRRRRRRKANYVAQCPRQPGKKAENQSQLEPPVIPLPRGDGDSRGCILFTTPKRIAIVYLLLITTPFFN
jgi:hypothetical protein